MQRWKLNKFYKITSVQTIRLLFCSYQCYWPLRLFVWQSEETKSSDKNGAYGILSAITISIIVGWGYILGLAFVVVDPTALLDTTNDAGGYAIAQIFYSTFKTRYGSGAGGIVCLLIVAVAIFFCGMSSITSNSRWFLMDDIRTFNFILYFTFYDIPWRCCCCPEGYITNF